MLARWESPGSAPRQRSHVDSLISVRSIFQGSPTPASTSPHPEGLWYRQYPIKNSQKDDPIYPLILRSDSALHSDLFSASFIFPHISQHCIIDFIETTWKTLPMSAESCSPIMDERGDLLLFRLSSGKHHMVAGGWALIFEMTVECEHPYGCLQSFLLRRVLLLMPSSFSR